MWKIMRFLKKQAWTHARLHPINTIKPRKKPVNHPFNFDKEYLFGYETLVFATSGILSMHKQLVTLQRESKLEITSYDPFKLYDI